MFVNVYIDKTYLTANGCSWCGWLFTGRN